MGCCLGLHCGIRGGVDALIDDLGRFDSDILHKIALRLGRLDEANDLSIFRALNFRDGFLKDTL
eukprot:4475309-Prorocentrum_lima.AAC.1